MCDILDYSFSVTIGIILVSTVILLFRLVGNAPVIVIVYKREELRKIDELLYCQYGCF